jgi:DNA (cytosine-5)-methyltransferase 1
MWFQFSKILRAKKPKHFIAENVKGLLSHDGGKSMERICEELCDCGYAIDFEVLNAKNFGVPQSRERVFIIGIRLDLLNPMQIF